MIGIMRRPTRTGIGTGTGSSGTRGVGVGLFLSAGVVVGVAVACSADPLPPEGEIVLVVQTDVALPDSFDRVRVEISNRGDQKFGNDYDVGPNKLRIPATLGVLRPEDDPSAPITFRLIARKNGTAKMLREVVTTIPNNRVAALRLPIRWLCDDTANESSPTNVTEKRCPPGQTCVGGDCYGSTIDSNELPPFVDGDVAPGAPCFDVINCVGRGGEVVVDPVTCTFPKPPNLNLANLNVALGVTNDGICDPTRTTCFVILDRVTTPTGPLDGWRESGGSIQLPQEV
jgi:hypothetical protein